MSDNVTATDIARMSGISRAAVSNWRRRYADFPEPVGGTATSPTYRLDEVAEWLTRHGKAPEKPQSEQAMEDLWHRMRSTHAADELPGLVAAIGDHLTGRRSKPPVDIATGIDLTNTFTALDFYHFLLERLRENAAERPSPAVPELAAVAAAVLPPEAQQIYDPACGLCATFLELARQRTVPTSLIGQDLSGDWIELARPLLDLHDIAHRLAVGDSIHDDAWDSELADAAICDIPVGVTDWQRDELMNDPRLAYGIPPRAEAELLWIQHCLGHVKTGGLVVASMPAAAAYRRSGRRIRAELLRRGALVAVVAPDDTTSHIWVLRRPESSTLPAQVLMATTTDVAGAWRRFVAEPPTPIADTDAVTVPVVTLLDDVVDLTPQTRVRQALRRPIADRFTDQAERQRAALADAPEPWLVAVDEPAPSPTVTVAELERQGALRIEGTRTDSARIGDVVVRNGPDGPRAFVCEAEPEPGDNGEYVVRCNGAELDAHWLAAALTAGMSDRPPATTTAGGYIRQVAVPRLPLDEQRRRGEEYGEFVTRENRLRAAAEAAAELTATAAEALVSGRMRAGSDR